MRKFLFFIVVITTIFFTGCNPLEIIKIEHGSLHFSLPAAKRSLPTQEDVEFYSIIVKSSENDFEQEKEGFPGDTVVFDNLLPGNYNVTVFAYDAAGNLIFQGYKGDIIVIPGIIKEVTVCLDYTTASIEISIIFPGPTPTSTAEPTPKPEEGPVQLLDLTIAAMANIEARRTEIEPVIINQYSKYYPVPGDISGDCVVSVEYGVNMFYDFNEYNDTGIIFNTSEGNEIKIIFILDSNKVSVAGEIDIIAGESHYIIFDISYSFDGVSEIEGSIDVDGIVYPAKDFSSLNDL